MNVIHAEFKWTRKVAFGVILGNLVLFAIFATVWHKQNVEREAQINQYEYYVNRLNHTIEVLAEENYVATVTNSRLQEELVDLQNKVDAKDERIIELMEIQRKAQYTTIKEEHMRTLIRAVLKYLDCYSRDFEEVLVFTVCIESEMGRLLVDSQGQALGAFQILPSTEKDILNRWLNTKGQEKLKSKIEALRACPIKGAPQLMTDLRYQVALAACNYIMRAGTHRIPNRKNTYEISRYYKKYYNTELGAATIPGAVRKYNLVLNSKHYVR